MAHEFFAIDVGLRLEIVSLEKAISSETTVVELRLRILDPKKRGHRHKENEAIQFDFDTENDNGEEVAMEMVKY